MKNEPIFSTNSLSSNSNQRTNLGSAPSLSDYQQQNNNNAFFDQQSSSPHEFLIPLAGKNQSNPLIPFL